MPAAVAGPVREEALETIKGLYVFTGVRRKCNFNHYRQQLADEYCVKIEVVDLDLEIDQAYDVTDASF